jgi:hypothetical protein
MKFKLTTSRKTQNEKQATLLSSRVKEPIQYSPQSQLSAYARRHKKKAPPLKQSASVAVIPVGITLA